MNDSDSSNTRRVTKDQKLHLLQYLENHREFANYKVNNETQTEQWGTLANILNDLGGAHKDGDSWKRAWVNMRHKAKQKSIEYRNALKDSDGVNAIPASKKLTDLDRRIITFIPSEAILVQTDEGESSVWSDMKFLTKKKFLYNKRCTKIKERRFKHSLSPLEETVADILNFKGLLKETTDNSNDQNSTIPTHSKLINTRSTNSVPATEKKVFATLLDTAMDDDDNNDDETIDNGDSDACASPKIRPPLPITKLINEKQSDKQQETEKDGQDNLMFYEIRESLKRIENLIKNNDGCESLQHQKYTENTKLKNVRRTDLQSHCRTCLVRLEPMHVDLMNLTPKVTNLLLFCTTLDFNVANDVHYPQRLCAKCYNTLQNFTKFQQMAMLSENNFKSIVKNDLEEEERAEVMAQQTATYDDDPLDNNYSECSKMSEPYLYSNTASESNEPDERIIKIEEVEVDNRPPDEHNSLLEEMPTSTTTRYFNKPKSKIPGDTKEPASVFPSKPFSVLEDFLKFSYEMEASKLRRQRFITALVDINSGNNKDKFIRSSWRRLLTDAVAEQFSWRGTPVKRSVRDNSLTFVIRTAFQQKFGASEDDECFNAVCQKYFRYAHDRRMKAYNYHMNKVT